MKETRTAVDRATASPPPRKEKSDLVRRMQEKVPGHDENGDSAHAQQVPDVIKASDSMTATNAFDEVLAYIHFLFSFNLFFPCSETSERYGTTPPLRKNPDTPIGCIFLQDSLWSLEVRSL